MVKVAFIMVGQEWLSYEALSAALKLHVPDVQVRVFYDPQAMGPSFFSVPRIARLLDMQDKLIHDLKQWEPDIIGFSVLNSSYPWAVTMARRIKAEKIDAPILFGGMHFTLSPERVMQQDCVDFGCVGEGEDMLINFVRSFQSGSIDYDIESLVYRKNGVVHKNPLIHLKEDLDHLAWPDKDVVYAAAPAYEKMRTYVTMTMRGCPYTCSFCSHSRTNRMFQGIVKPVRRRSVDNVIAELKYAKQKYRMKRIFFFDEVFTISEKWLEEFAEKYRAEVNLPFRIDAHPMNMSDRVIDLLAYANCATVQIGVQTPNEEIRRGLFNRNHSNQKLIEVLDKLHTTRIHVGVDNIVQIPDQSLEEIVQYADFYMEHRVDVVYAFLLRYFPGTEITEEAHRAGYLSDEEYEGIYNGLYAPEASSLAITAKEKEERLSENLVAATATMYEIRGENDSKEIERLRVLLASTPLMPRSVYRLLRKHALWRFIPASALITAVVRVGMDFWLRVVHKKRRIRPNPGPFRYAQEVLWVARMQLKFTLRRWLDKKQKPGSGSVREDVKVATPARESELTKS